MFPGTMRPVPDPEAEMSRLAAERKEIPQSLVLEKFLEQRLPGAGTAYFIGLTVTVQQAREIGEDVKPWPYPVRADLGARIMNLIRQDCAENPPA